MSARAQTINETERVRAWFADVQRGCACSANGSMAAGETGSLIGGSCHLIWMEHMQFKYPVRALCTAHYGYFR